ncbi:late competence development ComFB family protein [Clostridium cylindrosporum]|uniref:Late competence development protein ComFB n=1 Tax=Clostridium cylindrosporum DSM 605 TaxID=1121307 RepID=A0A0J8D9J6_CLOCY|nr:late competence development ComFB family protein [Clostridium cylindrosporum]KMT20973.1 hypothetical protein CLCY_1c02070 [Clostridium cylindrosporum DSM 605]
MVKNYMEDVVEDLVDKLWNENTDKDFCKCEKCKNDVIALSLNKLPPKYFSSDKGNIWTKLIFADNQKMTDVMTAVAEAMKIVKSSQRH